MKATNKTNDKIDIESICRNMVYSGLTSVHTNNNTTVTVDIKSDYNFLSIVKTSWDDSNLIWDDDTVAIDKYGCCICLLDDSTVTITGIPVKKFCNMLKKEINKYNKTIASRDAYIHELVINGLD